ncbi:uncharacterized protein LOC122298895 [Carya illinoinensis]|uniref:uncharacterized protein LOC122298895 n=1 Tax=Carya illinoinensis TaxID=32201 RepID=UPI001C721FEF|nr:uncharacterized protein LOC122298895 [Carya illinoinensis]
MAAAFDASSSSLSQSLDAIVKIKGEVQEDKRHEFSIFEHGTLRFKGRICVPNVKEIRDVILKEAHCSLYTVRLGSTKMLRRNIRGHPGYYNHSLYQFGPGFPKAPQGQDAAWTNGQLERTVQILEDMLRACVMDFKGSWIKYLPLIEFAYNNSYQESIQAAPYEVLYGPKCRSPLYWDEVGECRILG